MEVRDLSPDHESELQDFPCKQYRRPWTNPVEDAIRRALTWNLRKGRVRGVGLWNDAGVLVGVTAWAIDPNDPSFWTSTLVAVRFGHLGKGYAKRLKSEVVNRARGAGASRLISLVHRDNKAMIALNERHFGAKAVLDPSDWRREYLIFTIAL